jgi:hypothetical protein
MFKLINIFGLISKSLLPKFNNLNCVSVFKDILINFQNISMLIKFDNKKKIQLWCISN